LKDTRCLPSKRLGGPQIQPGRFGELKNLSPLLGMETRYVGRPARSLVPVQTMLYYHIKIMQHLHVGTTTMIGLHEKGLEITSSGSLHRTIAKYHYI